MLIQGLTAEDNLGHINTVLRPAHLGDGAKVGLVRQGHVRQQHIEMPLADRHITGLAGHKTSVMQGRRHIGQSDEILKRRNVAITPALLKIPHKRSAIDGRKHLMPAADGDGALGISGELPETAWGVSADLADPVSRRANHVFLDPDLGLCPPQRQGFGIIAECDTHILNDPVHLRFQARDRIVIERIKKRQPALNLRLNTGGGLLRAVTGSSVSTGHAVFLWALARD